MKVLILLSLLSAPLFGGVALADGAALSGHAKGGDLALFGTLCSGEFECKAAPLYTRVAVVAHVADSNVKNNVITKKQAKHVSQQAHKALALLDSAKAVCAQDTKSGQCAGDAFKASLLLNEAATILAPL